MLPVVTSLMLTKYGELLFYLCRKPIAERYQAMMRYDKPSSTISNLYLSSGAKNLEYLDKHFLPMHLLCQPCATNFDLIGIYDKIGPESEVKHFFVSLLALLGLYRFLSHLNNS